jgi:DNA topoisomerase-2
LSKKTIEDRYKKLTHREHVLQRSDTYIGSTNSELQERFIVSDIENLKIERKLVNYNAGFLKIFDEVLSNASDHYLRTKKVKYIKVHIDDDYISVENDGPGIPIEMHKEHKIYVPELIFGHLLTGENYDDDDERAGVGRNGYGAKLCNIFSKKFIVETADKKKIYYQEFTDNLENIDKPQIKKSKKEFTKITFYPDFDRFGMINITENDKKILLKRIIDIAVYTKIKVYYNDVLIPIKSFDDYIKMHTNDEIFYEKLSSNWEVGVSSTNTDEFQQVSLVNGVTTYQGGTHVNFITNQIVKELKLQLEKKHKKVTIKENDIKSKLFIFLNSQVINPEFDTQSKETLKTRLTNKHIGDIQVSSKLIKQIMSSEIIEDIMNYIQIKERAELKKLNKGKKNKVRIRKLDDANKAGTAKSKDCVLFLAEGDSASSTIITGFSTTGRDFYGVFPLKGKPLNVRKSTMKKILANDEIKNIISALGLEFGEKYNDVSDLRYGKVVFAGDADDDGSHIKGLLINLFEFFWPELLKLNYLYDFVTPIVKIEKGKKHKFFYKLRDYKKWKKTKQSGWFVTYYKGLGTIEANEIKDFFKTIDKFLIPFNYDSNPHNIIDLAFNEKRSDDRKEWLTNYIPGIVIDKFVDKTTFESFFNKEFIEFSMADNKRSIPSVIDGFKPSQRKILYTLFKKKYKNKVKVSQFAGAVTEETAYHHGPMSLEGAIINMAQDFVGTNNINLLEPKGAFGTRLKGGKDAASSRYIFTMLSELTKNIFMIDDNDILKYLHDDGFPIEPEYYVPIIPMILVNGAEGIGTGWSTSVLNYNPIDIIKYLVLKIKDKTTPKLEPFFNGFKGKIIFDEDKNRYITQGIINKKTATQLRITELPVNMWNDKYYTILDKLEDDKIIKSYTKNDTDENVDILINVAREDMKNIEKNLMNIFKLETYFSQKNMILFDSENKIKHYNDIYSIIDEFYNKRLEYYKKRKEYQLNKLEHDKLILVNKMKFINEILKGNLEIQNKKRTVIEKNMETLKLVKIDDSYNYLLNISLLSLSNEKLIELKNIYIQKKQDILELEQTSLKKIWLRELNILYKKLKK